MRAVDLIRKKRDGGELSREEIGFLIAGCTRSEIPDYQVAAWLMAVFLRGMTGREVAALTEAMVHSGRILDLSDLPGKKIDKHSTGGVGDKTSLIIAPIVAAAGVVVPMVSGRALGHSGGTLDKLESIPGFRVNLSLEEFHRALVECGCALIGQTAEIAPADKKLYALRDVIGAIESPPLICGSIMSKKLAEGIDGLVLDVKTGSGAFMKAEADAVALAELLVETGQRMGKTVVALVTAMDQPLGSNVGNALEVAESVEVLRGDGPADLRHLCLELAAWMLHLAGRVPGIAQGKALAEKIIATGQALDKFRQIVKQQGGDERVVDDPSRLPHAQHRLEVASLATGVVAAIDCEKIGVASMRLGAGRDKKEDAIDYAVGLVVHKKLGDPVQAGEPLCTLHYNSDARAAEAATLVRQSYDVAASANTDLAARKLIRRVIQAVPSDKSSAK